MTIRQCQTVWWIRIQTEVVIQCRGRHVGACRAFDVSGTYSHRPLQPEPSEHPASTPRGVVGFSDNQPVSEPMEQSKTGGNLVPKPAPSEFAEQPRSDGTPLWGEGLSPGTDTVSLPLPVALLGVALESQQSEDPSQMDKQETTGTRPESGEAIVVGAIGSVAPWFLTGWVHEVEIEFMINTGCPVTILSTTVFERMCTVDPAVRSTLRPCLRRLVSADSSPLIVQGQLELAIVFPGLCCDMLFVVANICSDGLLGTGALQSYLPHQLDLRTGQLWADGWSTLQLHQRPLTPDLDGLLTTSVVIPPDSEIVAKFSVSGISPHGCALVEPARCLTEEYGVVVGHTLVDASSGSGSVLIVNPNAEVVVLPGLTLISKLVPVAAISVAMEDTGLPNDEWPRCRSTWKKSSGALTRCWVTQADNYFGI